MTVEEFQALLDERGGRWNGWQWKDFVTDPYNDLKWFAVDAGSEREISLTAPRPSHLRDQWTCEITFRAYADSPVEALTMAMLAAESQGVKP